MSIKTSEFVTLSGKTQHYNPCGALNHLAQRKQEMLALIAARKKKLNSDMELAKWRNRCAHQATERAKIPERRDLDSTLSPAVQPPKSKNAKMNILGQPVDMPVNEGDEDEDDEDDGAFDFELMKNESGAKTLVGEADGKRRRTDDENPFEIEDKEDGEDVACYTCKDTGYVSHRNAEGGFTCSDVPCKCGAFDSSAFKLRRLE